MGRKPTKVTKQPSFFKVLLDGFTTHLSIPHKFTRNYIRPSLLGKCVLKGPCGNRNVGLKRRNNGLFFQNHGWNSFVKDHLLQLGDFLVFRYDGKSEFKVKIYDRTCCEIDVEAVAPKRKNGFPTSTPSENKGHQFSWVEDEIVYDQEANSDTENENGYISGKNGKLEKGEKPSTKSIVFKSDYSCFKVTISRYSRYRVITPKDLANDKGLESKKTMEVEDSNGKMWPVKVVIVDSSVGISTGWVECCKANKIVEGDTVVFEFVEDDVMRIHVVSKGVGRRGGHNRVVLDAPNINK